MKMSRRYYMNHIDMGLIFLGIFTLYWVEQDGVNPLLLIPAAFYVSLFPFARITFESVFLRKVSDKHWTEGANSLQLPGELLLGGGILTLPLCIIYAIARLKSH